MSGTAKLPDSESIVIERAVSTVAWRLGKLAVRVHGPIRASRDRPNTPAGRASDAVRAVSPVVPVCKRTTAFSIAVCRHRVFELDELPPSGRDEVSLLRGPLSVPGVSRATVAWRVHEERLSESDAVALRARASVVSADEETVFVDEAFASRAEVTSETAVPAHLRAEVDLRAALQLELSVGGVRGQTDRRNRVVLSVDLCGTADAELADERGASPFGALAGPSRRADLEDALIEEAARFGLDPRRLMPAAILEANNQAAPGTVFTSEDIDVSRARYAAWVVHVAEASVPAGGVLRCEMLAIDQCAGTARVDPRPLATLEPGVLAGGRVFVLPLPIDRVRSVRMVIVSTIGARIHACAGLALG